MTPGVKGPRSFTRTATLRPVFGLPITRQIPKGNDLCAAVIPLLRQKEILLQEMRHRVANSLQIIASILLLKARTVQSEEIRLHLYDAHQRVMSVATVQQQLQASGLNESIEIGPYLSRLCDSLAKSMVGERRPVSIKVQATSGAATSSEVVSVGLIVTELVINALKHAFSSGETGESWSATTLRALAGAYRYRIMARGLETIVLRDHISVSARALLKRWPVNSTPRSRNPVAPRGRPSQLLRAQQREAPSGVQVLTPLAGRWRSVIDPLRLNGVRPWPGRIRNQRRSRFR